MEKNKEEFLKYKKELEEYLFQGEEENYEVDENNLKMTLYKLLKYCLLTREYIINIGNYEINMTPQDLGIIYRGNGLYFEISNDDFYERSERNTEVRYFVISSDKRKESFEQDEVSSIEVAGTILNINGEMQELYSLALYSNNPRERIRNYINLKNGMEITEDSNNLVYLKKPINRNDPRTDIYDYLDQNRIQPVHYYQKESKFVPLRETKKEYNPNNYTELIPDQSKRRKLSKTIYSFMVDYYTRYMKENKF